MLQKNVPEHQTSEDTHRSAEHKKKSKAGPEISVNKGSVESSYTSE